MKKSIYWNILPLLATKADFMLCIGQRGNGKTYGVLQHFLKQYKKTGKRFCYLRRWDEDIKAYRMEQLFAPFRNLIDELFGEEFTIVYKNHKFFLVNGNGTKVDILGYVLSVSSSAHTKSISYTNVGFILYDEFIRMTGEQELRDEMSRFDNTLSTIIRGDNTNVKVFMLANTVSKYSPFFLRFGIDINKIEQGSITVKEIPLETGEVLKVALEYCEFNAEASKNISKYSTNAMIKSGKWEIPETDEIPTVPGSVIREQLLFTIFSEEVNVTIGCFLRREKWAELIKNDDTMLFEPRYHVREFLVLRTVERKSSYYHLSTEKSLKYTDYNDIGLMLSDIKENTDIDFEDELFRGRVFCDNCFTGDYFCNAWIKYGRVAPRNLL